jgi:thiol-disulfide isomerase/thioredoxin
MSCIGLRRSGQKLSSAWLGGILSLVVVAIQAAPLNDNLASATVLTGATNFVITSNAGATRESGEPYHASANGGKSVWWSWQSPFTGSASISTAGSSFDTLLAAYTGNAISNLQLVAANDDDGGFGAITSSLVFRAYAGETYRIAVDGFEGATGAVQLAIGRAGYPAPAWQITEVRSNQLVTSSGYPNKVVMIDFWETTCAACVEEMADLIQLHYDYSPDGLAILGVSKDPTNVNIRYYAETKQIPYTMARTTETMESAFGGVDGMPTKFVIDRDNRVVGAYIGGGTYSFYENILRPLLRRSTVVPLNARRHGPGLVLAWPGTESGFEIETTDSLGETNWTTASFPVVTTNNENTVTIPVSSGSQFYRLRKGTSGQ